MPCSAPPTPQLANNVLTLIHRIHAERTDSVRVDFLFEVFLSAPGIGGQRGGAATPLLPLNVNLGIIRTAPVVRVDASPCLVPRSPIVLLLSNWPHRKHVAKFKLTTRTQQIHNRVRTPKAGWTAARKSGSKLRPVRSPPGASISSRDSAATPGAASVKANSLCVVKNNPSAARMKSNGSSAAQPNSTSPPGDVTLQYRTPGCGSGLSPVYSFLCDTRAVWGIIVEALAALGFLVTAGLLVCLVAWMILQRVHHVKGVGGSAASLALFLLGAGGLFGLTFAFIIQLSPQTCPTRVFLFGVLMALCFSTLLSHALSLHGAVVVPGWGGIALVLGLTAVQAIIGGEWLLVVLVRDQQPCHYSQGEFVMLLIYVMCLLVAGLCCSAQRLCWGQAKVRAAVIFLTLVLSAAVWVVWISLLTRGNWAMGRRPMWDDPVLSIALVSNAWVLLLGHGFTQMGALCRAAGTADEGPLDFTGWTSPSGELHTLGRENRSFEGDVQDRKGKRKEEEVWRSPYESGFSMTNIDPHKDFSIPRPQTTNANVHYSDYYGQRLSD
ncbi:G-protein coupled receptor family C group 5 member D-like [Arapaima gigas]